MCLTAHSEGGKIFSDTPGRSYSADKVTVVAVVMMVVQLVTLSTKHGDIVYLVSSIGFSIFYFVIYENNRQSSLLQIPDTKKDQPAIRLYFTWEALANEAPVSGHTGRV